MAGFFSRPVTVVVNDATVLSFNRFFGHNKECHEIHDDDIPSQNDADYKLFFESFSLYALENIFKLKRCYSLD